ncbi:serine carboxypeptidase-like protein 40 [Tanacetum coccineum]|uniref:Serine carboxypeptidase-like protein 40 n=1 Tax=Tanacetum coccineum TaxID=301880 RepID=A0ABQ5AJK1_9ASTR
MEKTTLWALLISLFFSCLIWQISAHNKQARALDHLYRDKRFGNSAIDISLFEPPLYDSKPSVVLPQEDRKNSDKIDRLPGQPNVSFDQYGGYITVNESAGRAFYYYFVEAENSNKSLPLLLWLNGGPGCSSLAYGAMQELGPFRVNSDGKTLYRNEFAWNQVANVLFVESPAGVGFSYSNSSSHYRNYGDRLTAADNYVFMLNWLERFPEYKERDFYISGENYAGHYVPQLAHTILHNNNMANRTLINLKGILIGNPVIYDRRDPLVVFDYLDSHAIASSETLDQMRTCHGLDECFYAIGDLLTDLAYIDINNIYAPLCLDGNLTSEPKPMSQSVDPCCEHYTYAYMNRKDVQDAIHANVTNLNHAWDSCSFDVILAWYDRTRTVIPLLRELMENNLRVWIFSSDTDAQVPVTSTKHTINSMNLTEKTPWHPWLVDHQGETGGFSQVYDGDLTFSTVLGAGHQVPSYKPKSALALVLVNRIKPILPRIVHENQSAFILDRMIIDNAIVAFEVMHWLKNKKQGKRGALALKIDISKAYDKVEWHFIRAVLENFGFPTRFTNLIMACVSSVSYSFNINGQVAGHVTPARGLRQGDPISPYLFIMCAGVLSSMIRKSVTQGHIHGVKVCRGAPAISHLFFADDSIFFLRASNAEVINLKNILVRYCRSKKVVFQAIIDKIKKKLKGWKEKTLSIGGKEVLIKSVTQAMPMSFVAKQVWRLITNPTTLAAKVLKARYFPRSSFFDANVGYRPSYDYWLEDHRHLGPKPDNCDVTYVRDLLNDEESRRAGLGFVAQNASGDVLLLGALAECYASSPLEAEAKSLLWATTQTHNKGYSKIIFELDLLYLVNALQRGRTLLQIASMLAQIMSNSVSFNSFNWSFVKREGNKVVHSKATWALGCSDELILEGSVPECARIWATDDVLSSNR